jgi:hypothetical protein
MTMPRSNGRRSDPAPSAYRPHVAARRPGGRPSVKPLFRVLVHRQFLGIWNELPARVGLANAQQFWDHVAMTPGQPPRVLESAPNGGTVRSGRGLIQPRNPAPPEAPAIHA